MAITIFLQCRNIGDNKYEGTTWKIKFQLDSADAHGTYRLRLALATAHAAELQVWNSIFVLYSTTDDTPLFFLFFPVCLLFSLETKIYCYSKVRLNDAHALPPLFTTGLIGKDNTIARHGIHGLYRLYTVDIPGCELVVGNNTILLTQINSNSPFVGIMYDYLRLEGPLTSKM